MCKDARRLCGESIKLVRMEGGSFSTSLSGVETTVVSKRESQNIPLPSPTAELTVEICDRRGGDELVSRGNESMGLRNVAVEVALGCMEQRVASVLVVGQGPGLVLAP